MSDRQLIIEKVGDIAALEAIKNEWNDLLATSDTKTVELTFEWQITYHRHFYSDSELYVLVVKRGSKLIAIAPLRLVYINIPFKRIRSLEFIAADESNYQDFIAGTDTDEVLPVILAYLYDHRSDWDVIRFKHLSENSMIAQILAKKNFSYPWLSRVDSDQCIYLELEKSWEEHKKSLGKNRRHRMANRVRRMEREIGKVQLKQYTIEDQFQPTLSKFFELHRKRWDNTDTPSQFLDKRYCGFYSEVSALLLPKKELRISALVAGDIIVSSLILFTFQNQAIIQLIAYDPDYYVYSPMLVLQELLVEDLCNQGIDIIDWGTYYSWKELWGNKLKERINLYLYPKRFFPVCIYIFSVFSQMLRDLIRRYPKIIDFARYLRHTTKSLLSDQQVE